MNDVTLMWRLVMDVDMACCCISWGPEFKEQLVFIRCNEDKGNIFSSL